MNELLGLVQSLANVSIVSCNDPRYGNIKGSEREFESRLNVAGMDEAEELENSEIPMVPIKTITAARRVVGVRLALPGHDDGRTLWVFMNRLRFLSSFVYVAQSRVSGIS